MQAEDLPGAAVLCTRTGNGLGWKDLKAPLVSPPALGRDTSLYPRKGCSKPDPLLHLPVCGVSQGTK